MLYKCLNDFRSYTRQFASACNALLNLVCVLGHEKVELGDLFFVIFVSVHQFLNLILFYRNWLLQLIR